MTQLMSITSDGADFADRLRELLEDFGLDLAGDEQGEELGLIPAFVLGGASVRTQAHAHGEHMHVTGITVEIADELEDAFYSTLNAILEANSEEDDSEG